MSDPSPAASRSPAPDTISVVDFAPRHAAAFRALNIAWLQRYFAVEDKDREQLGDAQGRVIDRGGAVLMAEDEAGTAVGCVALIPFGDGELELAKMAVAEVARGRGVGRMLMDAAIARARALGARSLYLESNSRLVPAVTLYERSGFEHLSVEARPGARYARCDVYMRRML